MVAGEISAWEGVPEGVEEDGIITIPDPPDEGAKGKLSAIFEEGVLGAGLI